MLSAVSLCFAQDPNYLAMTLEVLKLALHDSKVHETDAMPAPKLIGTVLQHCRGQVDEYLEQYIMLAVTRLHGDPAAEVPAAEKDAFKCLLMTVNNEHALVGESICRTHLRALQALSNRHLTPPNTVTPPPS